VQKLLDRVCRMSSVSETRQVVPLTCGPCTPTEEGVGGMWGDRWEKGSEIEREKGIGKQREREAEEERGREGKVERKGERKGGGRGLGEEGREGEGETEGSMEQGRGTESKRDRVRGGQARDPSGRLMAQSNPSHLPSATATAQQQGRFDCLLCGMRREGLLVACDGRTHATSHMPSATAQRQRPTCRRTHLRHSQGFRAYADPPPALRSLARQAHDALQP
jgi:hypothetical protein